LVLEITDVKVLSEKNFIGNPKDIILGVIKSVDRRAKILVIKVASPPEAERQFYIDHLKNDRTDCNIKYQE